MDEASLREQIILIVNKMISSGINQGTSGNISARFNDGMIITPSSLSYETMKPNDLVYINLTKSEKDANNAFTSSKKRKPSSEWKLHSDIYSKRPEINSVLHCHSIYATALSCHCRGIPSFHYMVALAGGNDIKCSKYATFGSQELSNNALQVLNGRYACLLSNHGQLTLGTNLEKALSLAIEVETLANMFLQALQLGEPLRLTNEEMRKVSNKFRTLSYKN